MSMPGSALRPVDRSSAIDTTPLTPEQKRLVRESFAAIAPAADLVAAAFYRRLFEIAPDVQPMFSGDMAELRGKLVLALRLAVLSLDRLDDIMPLLKLLGARNRAQGVEPVHYGHVAEALLWTLGNVLKDRFTSDFRDAWVALYTLMAEVMTAGE